MNTPSTTPATPDDAATAPADVRVPVKRWQCRDCESNYTLRWDGEEPDSCPDCGSAAGLVNETEDALQGVILERLRRGIETPRMIAARIGGDNLAAVVRVMRQLVQRRAIVRTSPWANPRASSRIQQWADTSFGLPDRSAPMADPEPIDVEQVGRTGDRVLLSVPADRAEEAIQRLQESP